MLSGAQLKKLVPGVKILRYIDLQKYDNIDQIVPPQGLILLYPSMEGNKRNDDSGHWVCLFKQNNTMFYFDPYGTKIDQCLIDFETLGSFREGQRFMLSQLLNDSPYSVDFNNFQLQNGYVKGSKEIDTCGYWVVARLRSKQLSSDRFYDLFSRENNPDKDMDQLIVNFVMRAPNSISLKF